MHASNPFSVCELGPRPRTTDRAELAEWAERLALHDLFAAAPGAIRASAGLFVSRLGPALAFGAPGIDSLFVNRIFLGGAEDERPVVEAAVRTLEAFEARGVRHFFVHVPPASATGALVAALETRSIGRYHRSWVELARGPGQPSPVRTPYAIRAAGAADGPAFARITARSFGFPDTIRPLLATIPGRPRWHVYLALDGARPVASGALFAHGDVGHLSFGATLPAYRGRGAQRALLSERIRVAVALGCRTIVAETGARIAGEPNPSYDNMVRLGFEPVAVRQNFAPVGTTWR